MVAKKGLVEKTQTMEKVGTGHNSGHLIPKRIQNVAKAGWRVTKRPSFLPV